MRALRTGGLERALRASGLDALYALRDQWVRPGANALARLLRGRAQSALELPNALVALLDPTAQSRIESLPGSVVRAPACRLPPGMRVLVAARPALRLGWSIAWQRTDLVVHARTIVEVFARVAERVRPLSADALLPHHSWPGAMVVSGSVSAVAWPERGAFAARARVGTPRLLVSLQLERSTDPVAYAHGAGGAVFTDAAFERRWRNVSPIDACWAWESLPGGSALRLTPLRNERLPLRVAAVDAQGRPLAQACEWTIDDAVTRPERHPLWPEVWTWPGWERAPRPMTLRATGEHARSARLSANPLVLEPANGAEGELPRYVCGATLNLIAGIARQRATTRARVVAERIAPALARPLTAWDVCNALCFSMLEVRDARAEATDAVVLQFGKPALVRALDIEVRVDPGTFVHVLQPAIRAALLSVMASNADLEVGDVRLAA